MKRIFLSLMAIVMVVSVCFSFASCTQPAPETMDITVCVGPDPETLDPAMNSSVDGAIILTNCFAGIYGYDKDLNIVPDCAEAIVTPEAIEGGKYQYVITLKDGLKWSDGVAVKASDFEYAWNRAADPATGADYQYIFDVIDGYAEVSAIDDNGNRVNPDAKLNVTADDENRTLTIVTSAYCSYFDQLLAFATYYPVRKDVVEANDSWATNVATYICNGPFKMKSWTVGSNIVFEKNANYWEADKVNLDTLTFFLSDDDDAIFANYKNNSLQYTTQVPVAQIPVLKADADRFNVDFFIGDYIGTYYLELNVEKSFKPGLTLASSDASAWTDWTPAQNAEVRHALGLLIDRNYIVEQVTRAGQLPAYGFIPAGMSDGNGKVFREEADAWWSVEAADLEANKAEAVEILKKYYDFDEATGKFTNFPKFEYSANPTSGNLAICAAIQQMWKPFGIEVEVDQRTWSVIQTALTDGDFTLSRLGWIADYNDPVNFLEIELSNSGNNHPHLGKALKDGTSNVGMGNFFGPNGDQSWAGFDELISKIKTTADTEERANYMYEAEEWIRDTYTIIPLYYYTNPYLCSTQLVDYIYSPLGWVSYKYAKLAD